MATLLLVVFFGAPRNGVADTLRPGVHYLHRDCRGDVLMATDVAGNPGARQRFGSYGVVSPPGATLPVARGPAGQVHDSASGLDYLHARYYDAAAGRFLSADPVQQFASPLRDHGSQERFPDNAIVSVRARGRSGRNETPHEIFRRRFPHGEPD